MIDSMIITLPIPAIIIIRISIRIRIIIITLSLSTSRMLSHFLLGPGTLTKNGMMIDDDADPRLRHSNKEWHAGNRKAS